MTLTPELRDALNGLMSRLGEIAQIEANAARQLGRKEALRAWNRLGIAVGDARPFLLAEREPETVECPACGGAGGFGSGGYDQNNEWMGEMCQECGGTGNAVPAVAAPERDAELEDLLHKLCAYDMDRGVANYRGDEETERELTSNAVDTMDAIHQHFTARLAQREREVRGEVVGTAVMISVAGEASVGLITGARIQDGESIPLLLVRDNG